MNDNILKLWEEKDLIEPKKNLLNKQTTEPNGIINETKNKFVKNECENIGNEKSWKRNCPDCQKELTYSNKGGLVRANTRKCRCQKCNNIYRYLTTNASKKISNALKGRIFSNQHKIKLSLSLKGKNNPMYGQCGILNPFYGKSHSIETKKKIGEKSIKINTGRKHTDATIKRWRILAIERKKKLGLYDNKPFYNPFACKFIETFGNQTGYNFQHATNGGEFHIEDLGYWVDGYDKEKNVVIEYNEPHHYDILGNLKLKDVRRINEIKKYLGCKFIIYNGYKKSIELL